MMGKYAWSRCCNHRNLCALGYLIVVGIAGFAWKQAYDCARNSTLRVALWKGALWCGGISVATALLAGEATCVDTADPLRGGCEE